jgi:hypothetical protein
VPGPATAPRDVPLPARVTCSSVSVWSVFAARGAATVAAHHAEPEPHQRPDQCRDEGEQPQRPGEAPEQERQRDAFGVLDHEDDKAERLLRVALASAEEECGLTSSEVAEVLNELAMTFNYARKFEEAERLYQRALAIVTGCRSAGHGDIASIYHNLGGLAHARGDYNVAELLARKAVVLREAIHRA